MHNFEDVHGLECLVTKPTRITDTTNHFHSCFLLSAAVALLLMTPSNGELARRLFFGLQRLTNQLGMQNGEPLLK